MDKQKAGGAAAPAEDPLRMGILDLIIPVLMSGSLMAACFALGHYGWSAAWIGVLTILYLLKTRLWITRQETRLRLRRQILRERGLLEVGTNNSELPVWITSPDVESIEWVNKVIEQVWPFASEYAAVFMREYIEPQVLDQMPSAFKSFRFVEIDMGDLPCRVSGLKVYTENVGRDRILVDLNIAYAGDANFRVKVCGLTGGMNELTLSGKVRCVLQPLIPRPPMIGGVSMSFVELPKFDFNLTGMGDFLQLPLLMDAIRSVINTQVANLCVLPNSIIMPLVPDLNLSRLYVPLPDGVVRIKVVEARDLENKDISFITKDKSDPYCELNVGSQLFKTRTINNNLNPKFDEYFEAVVDQVSAQQLRVCVFDEDTTRADEELGHLSVPLSYVKETGMVKRWFDLEACQHGSLQLELYWCQLTTEKVNPALDEKLLHPNRPVHSALMVVFIENIRDLPFPKANTEPSPIILVKYRDAVQKTPVKPRTINPVYLSKLLFLIKGDEADLDNRKLEFTALDTYTNRTLGELSISIRYLMQQPDMEVLSQPFQLRYGVHSSTMTLTIRIRNILAAAGEIADYAAYGNASHIERANGVPATQPANGIPNGVPNGKPNGGEALAPEVGKVPETDPETYPESTTKLKPSRFPSMGRSYSANQINGAAAEHEDGLMKKIFKPFKRDKEPTPSLRGITTGKLSVGLSYYDQSTLLLVHIHSVNDITPPVPAHGVSPYVSVKLFAASVMTPKSKQRTIILADTLNPVFETRMEFKLTREELAAHKLQFLLKDNKSGILSRPPLIGQTEISLNQVLASPETDFVLNFEHP